MNSELILSLDSWVKSRPYLKSIASTYLAIFKVLNDFKVEKINLNLDHFSADFENEVSFFYSGNEKLFSVSSITDIVLQICKIADDDSTAETAKKFVNSLARLITEDRLSFEEYINLTLYSPENSGLKKLVEKFDKAGIDTALLEIITWLAVRYRLSQDIKRINKWQADKSCWESNRCPTCGNEASMAELQKGKRGRERKLVCEHCGSKWVYKRIGCAYCDNIEPKDLSIIEIDEESDFRIDLCKKCNCYIKTYIGEDESGIALFDFASIHLDYIPKEKLQEKVRFGNESGGGGQKV